MTTNKDPKPSAVERRHFVVPMEVRADAGGDDAPPKIVGHAAVFNQLSEDLGGFREKIAPGAFSKSIGGDVRAMFNHNPDMILGRTGAKTLTLSEDARGLAVEITPPDTETARHVIEALRRGDVTQMSFGFRTISDTWENEDGKIPVRTLNEVELFDVSPVTFPAYPQTDVAVRSLEAHKAENTPAPENDDGGGEEDANAVRTNLAKARTQQAIASL